ncbi:MAG: hypothetical protein HXS48_13535, partial [Theionarchaea archaeon]|nr:hypothetical protein [Theionarchaea archaeon]
MEDEKMEREYGYFVQFFNFAFVLRGEARHLEKIKERIIAEHVSKGHIRLVKPVYSKEELCLVDESKWKVYQRLRQRELPMNMKEVDESEFFTFACILRGEVSYLEEVKDILKEYAAKGHIEVAKSTYSTEKIFVVTEPEWRAFLQSKEGPEITEVDENEFFTFACILRGDVGHLEEVRDILK